MAMIHPLLPFLLLPFLPLLLSIPTTFAKTPSSQLDSTIRNCAFTAMYHRKTGTIYKVPLPSNLSGITSSVTRIGAKTLYTNGTRIYAINIPPLALPTPFVTRITVVYQNLGNQSSLYFNVPGYSLVAPVIGFLAYDALDKLKEVELNVTMLIRFANVGEFDKKCVNFGRDGEVQVKDVVGLDDCEVIGTGHFTMVVAVARRRRRWWWVWGVSGGGGVVGVVLLGVVGMRIFRVFRVRKFVEMEVKASEGEGLEYVWVGKSKMPCGAPMRTRPVLEITTTT